jgi:hypothetical protein
LIGEATSTSSTIGARAAGAAAVTAPPWPATIVATAVSMRTSELGKSTQTFSCHSQASMPGHVKRMIGTGWGMTFP